jgi:hypothetical protein
LISWSSSGIQTSLCELFSLSNLSYLFNISIALFQKFNVSEWFHALPCILYSRLTSSGFHVGYFLIDGPTSPFVHGITDFVSFQIWKGCTVLKIGYREITAVFSAETSE